MTANCPHCGAGVYDAAHYDCSTLIGIKDNARGGTCYLNEIERLKAEIAQLREKKAKPLVWEEQNLKHGGKGVIANVPSGWWRICYSDDCAVFINPADGQRKITQFGTLQAAKDHAEELHQKQHRELREKWDAVGFFESTNGRRWI